MKTVLQFSGGKDSLACLYLLKPRWNEIEVVWLNTGANLPEVVEFVRDIGDTLPNFKEMLSYQTIRERGWPADLVPTRETPVGHLAQGKWPEKSTTPLFQSRFQCCASTIWDPLHKAMQIMGAQVVIRGQRLSDAMRSPIVDGQVVDGIRYEFPLADWTDEQVEIFLKQEGVFPPAGCIPNSSIDCWNCTAYLDESAPKLRYLKDRHPDKHQQVMSVLAHLHQAITAESAPLEALLESV